MLIRCSDGTLNTSGIRFGSSEIYNILALPQFQSSIVDAIVVGQQRTKAPYSDTTERVLLFIACFPHASSNTLLPTEKLDSQIREQISKDLSRRHVPAHILEVTKIPYNANGKKLEIQVKKLVNTGSLVAGERVTTEEREAVSQYERFFHLEKALREARQLYAKL